MSINRIFYFAGLFTLLLLSRTAWAAESPEVLAQVGEDKLTAEMLDSQISSMPPQLQAMFSKNPEMKKKMVGQWVQMMLLAKEAKALDLENTPAVKAKIETVRNQILAEELISTKLDRETEVTPAALEEYYAAHKEEFSQKEEVQAQHILVRLAENAGPEETAKANATIKEIQEKLAKGESFATLASTYSEDPGSKNKGGDLGSFGQGQMVPEFEKVAFATPVGKVSEPVRSKFGIHLIKVNGKTPARVQTFEEVKDKISAQLQEEKKKTAFEELIKELKKKYPVKTSVEEAQ